MTSKDAAYYDEDWRASGRGTVYLTEKGRQAVSRTVVDRYVSLRDFGFTHEQAHALMFSAEPIGWVRS